MFCALFVISACVGTPTVRAPVIQSQILVPYIPAATLTCPVIPDIPDPDTPDASQRDIAIFIPDLINVAERCRRNLMTVRTIITKAAADAAIANEENQPES